MKTHICPSCGVDVPCDKQYQKSYSGGTARDKCQTPKYAFDILIPILKGAGITTVWDPACGRGNIHGSMSEHFHLLMSDVEPEHYAGIEHNFLADQTHQIMISLGTTNTCIVTNPPYSAALKKAFVEKCVELRKRFDISFCLLMKSDTSGTQAGRLLLDGMQCSQLIPTQRIDFEMPYKGDKGTATFHTTWYLSGNLIPDAVRYVDLDKPKRPRPTRVTKFGASE